MVFVGGPGNELWIWVNDTYGGHILNTVCSGNKLNDVSGKSIHPGMEGFGIIVLGSSGTQFAAMDMMMVPGNFGGKSRTIFESISY
jgi:hypothetical protein